MSKSKERPLRAAKIYVLATAVGALGGLLGFCFQSLLQLLQAWGLGRQSGESIAVAAERLADWQKVLVPATGGLLAALFLWMVHYRRNPFGITDIVGLVITRQGVIKLRESVVQIVSSACSIATGASIGKESANSQLAATASSLLSRWFHCNSRERAVLLGCGVSAGMAISYHAPIAGALFVMEVVLGNFAMDVFGPVVVAAVLATLIQRELSPQAIASLYGEGGVSKISMTDPLLVMSAILLGVLCAFAGIGFRRSLRLGGDALRRLKVSPLILLPAVGGIVGALGIARPEVWGNGQHVVLGIINSEPGYGMAGMLVGILLLKTLATSLSLGSGALGGVFTPNLVVGAALGGAYSFAVAGVVDINSLGLTDSQLRGGFALVGMAGLCAATTHAPITAVLLVFEFTRNYELILPVMICSIIASLVARMVDRDSIFSERLRDHQHLLAGGLEALTLQTNYVRDLMRGDTLAIPDTATFEEVMQAFAQARRDTFYVTDKDHHMVGRIHIHDVKYFMNDPSLTSAVIAADLTQPAASVRPEQTLAAIFHLFDDADLEELPVVASESEPALLGRLTRRDVIALLSDEILGHRSLRAKLVAEGSGSADFVELPADAKLARVAIPAALAGATLSSTHMLGTAGLTVLVVIEPQDGGGELRVLPRPDIVLPAGGALIVLGTNAAIDAFCAVAVEVDQ